MNRSILIVEDEPIIAMHIAATLEKNGFNVVEITAEGQHAIELTRLHKPDLVLMDIQIEGALSGIDVAKIISTETNTPIIFLTSQIDQVTVSEAILAKPAGYILKPFDEAELVVNIELALFKKHTEKAVHTVQETTYMFFKKEDAQIVKVNFADIDYIESAQNYVEICTHNKKMLVRNTLSAIENALPKSTFLRSHRSFLVNIKAIRSIQQNIIILEGGESIPMGKTYRQAFLESLSLLS